MTSIDAITLLLSNPEERSLFFENRRSWIDKKDIPNDEVYILEGIVESELKMQAKLLLDKRQNEVSELIPETWKKLNDKGPELFKQYAEHNWPDGPKKLFIDAKDFLNYLMSIEPESVSGKDWSLINIRLKKKKRFHWEFSHFKDISNFSGFLITIRIRKFHFFHFPIPYLSKKGRQKWH